MVTLEARAGADPAAEESNPIPVELGSPATPGVQDSIEARRSIPVALDVGNPIAVGDGVIPAALDVGNPIPVGDGVILVEGGGFMGSGTAVGHPEVRQSPDLPCYYVM